MCEEVDQQSREVRRSSAETPDVANSIRRYSTMVGSGLLTGGVMIWPYVCPIFALIAASLTLAGVAPVSLFAVITIAFAVLFVSTTARVFRTFGL